VLADRRQREAIGRRLTLARTRDSQEEIGYRLDLSCGELDVGEALNREGSRRPELLGCTWPRATVRRPGWPRRRDLTRRQALRGAAVELNQKNWAIRGGYFLVPTVSNVNTFDTQIPKHGEYIGELELRYSLFAQPGKLRLMGWTNIANMGSYAEALAMPVSTPNYPDITQTRQLRTNYGFVVNMEQAITNELGIFSRASWSPGLVEIIGWTDCDESFSFGTVLKGTAWGRPDDKIGVGGVVEGLSPIARAYFAAGGLGILIGDGQFNYRPEKIFEAYYAYSLNKWATLTFNYQFIGNPGYNADRGPVSVFSGRLHAQF
jgi:high affinity Mn2+ porin